MCSSRSDVAISKNPALTLGNEVTALQQELKRERRKNTDLEVMCWELNQENDQYLSVAMQLERAIENLLVALSLPTHSLYGRDATDYKDLLCLIDNEKPRLKTLISGLDLLAGLAVGLNRSVEIYKGQIRTLQEDVSRLDREKASIRGIKRESPAMHQRPWSPLQSFNNKNCLRTPLTNLDDLTTTSMSQTSVPTMDEVLPIVVSVASDQTQSKTVEFVQPPKTQKQPDTNEESERDKSGDAESMGDGERPLEISCHRYPAAFSILDIFTSRDIFQCCEIQCAVSVDGHPLAGNPFSSHPGWQIHFSSNTNVVHPIITLSFGFARPGSGKLGKHEGVKGFALIWELCREDSFDVGEVKAYKPASLRNLPLSLTKLCADKYVRGTLWMVSLLGKFDSPPAHSHRILATLGEDMKTNLKALFKPGSTNRIDIWFVNPKDSDRRKRKLDTDALIVLQSPS